MRVLALQLKRIGDLVLTTPALHALKASGMHVTLALTEATAALLPMLRDSVDEALVYHTRDRRNAPLWQRVWRGRFDACVDFTGRDRSALLTLASRARTRLTADALLRGARLRRLVYNTVAPAPVRSRHTVDHYLDFLGPLGLAPAAASPPPGPRLHLSIETMARAGTLLAEQGIGPTDDFVVVHPGTARLEKFWVPERWAEVIAFCRSELGCPCVLTGGRHDPDEQVHLAALRFALAERGENCVDLAGQLDLPTLAAVLARASLVLGVDSGPMHLAAAWARPQLVLFGPTNPFHWRPRHPAARILRAGHGDAPLPTFAERSPGGPMDGISTRAVIDCIWDMPFASALP